MPDLIEIFAALTEGAGGAFNAFQATKAQQQAQAEREEDRATRRELEALEKLILEGQIAEREERVSDRREAAQRQLEEGVTSRLREGEERQAERAAATGYLQKYPEELQKFAGPNGNPIKGTERLIVTAGQTLDRAEAQAKFRAPPRATSSSARDPLREAAIRIAEDEGITVDQAMDRLTGGTGEDRITDDDTAQAQQIADQIRTGTLTFEELFDQLGLARNFEGGGIAGHPLDIEFFKLVQRLVNQR